MNKIPPTQKTENHAQKAVVGDTGDTGGISDISMEQALLQYSNNNNVQIIEQQTQVRASSCSTSQDQINNFAI